MHTLLEQIRAQIGNVKEYVNKGHHHRAIVTELEKIEKRFAEYEEVAALAPALTAQVAALTAQCEGLTVSRDAYKRDAEGLLQISKAAAVYAVIRLNDEGQYPDDINGWELADIAEKAIAAGNGEGV